MPRKKSPGSRRQASYKAGKADIGKILKRIRKKMIKETGSDIAHVFYGPGVAEKLNILDCLKEQFPDGVFIGNNSFQAKAIKKVAKLNKKHETRRVRGKDGKQEDKGVDPRDYQ